MRKLFFIDMKKRRKKSPAGQRSSPWASPLQATIFALPYPPIDKITLINPCYLGRFIHGIAPLRAKKFARNFIKKMITAVKSIAYH